MDIKKYRSVALCGFRQEGRKIYKALKEDGILIPYIIERNYEALAQIYKDIDSIIVGFQEAPDFYSATEVIILSGDLPEEMIKECLALAEIDLPTINVKI